MPRLIGRLVALVLLLLIIGLVVGLTADSLGVVLARHTLQYRLMAALPTGLQPADPATLPTGGVTGTVTSALGQPVAGATVLVADRRGMAYRATTDNAGRYRLAGVPADVYRLVAAAPGHGPVADSVTVPTPFAVLGVLRWRPAVRVGADETRTADLRLTTPRRIAPPSDARLSVGVEEPVTRDEPFPGRVLRQSFTLTTSRRATTGLIHAPEASGQYPVVLVLYPGPPESWENVSIPIAAGGFTVVSYFPRNFPDLQADIAELLALTDALTAGQLTPHALPGRQCLAGGSFSTLWAFLLLHQTDAYQCMLSLGGISDAFLYRADWEAGRIVPDPALAPVPELMAALGPPNLEPDLYLWLSAIEHTASLPPLLLVHGTGDTIVPINQSVVLAERLWAEGRPVEVRLYSGMEHYLAADKADANTVDLLARTLAFFHSYLD